MDHEKQNFTTNATNHSLSRSPPTKPGPVLEEVACLDCPVCVGLPQGSIYQCSNGHSICKKCVEKMQRCPSCREPYQKTKIRNRYAEDILERMRFPCLWREQGCEGERFNRRQVESHAQLCSYNPSPIKLCRVLDGGACHFEISRSFFRNPTEDLLSILLEHFRTCRYQRLDFELMVQSEVVTKYLHFPNTVSNLVHNWKNQLFRGRIFRVSHNCHPVGFYMLWGYNSCSGSDSKLSWFFVRITDQPRWCDVHVQFSFKSGSTDKYGVPVSEVSWSGQVMGLQEFVEFRAGSGSNFNFSLPLSHLREHYSTVDGGIELQVRFIVIPVVIPEKNGKSGQKWSVIPVTEL